MSALSSIPHGVEVLEMHLLAALSALGLSLLNVGSGRVLPPRKKAIEEASYFPMWSNGNGNERVIGVEDFANDLVGGYCTFSEDVGPSAVSFKFKLLSLTVGDRWV